MEMEIIVERRMKGRYLEVSWKKKLGSNRLWLY